MGRIYLEKLMSARVRFVLIFPIVFELGVAMGGTCTYCRMRMLRKFRQYLYTISYFL